MTTFHVETNAPEVSAFMRRLFADQIPFATSKAINETALEFQREQRRGMQERFTIRRPWVLQGVKINRGDFATKSRPVARVHIDPARDFLVIHEEGGTKRPRGTRLAIPDEAKRTKADVVSRTQRPRALGFRFHGRGPIAEVWRGEKRTFMIRRHAGTTGGIYQRFGRGRGSVRQLFSFTPEAQIDDQLEFVLTAEDVVQNRFDDHFARAFERAVQTAR